MEELRPDISEGDFGVKTIKQCDDKVIAPVEPLDDRDSEDSLFTVDERFSCQSMNFSESDPAKR